MMRAFCLIAAILAAAHASSAVTPAQWLASQPKPVFKPGHNLPPLTKYGWGLPWELTVESATNWGYALDVGGAGLFGSAVTNALGNPSSTLAKGVALATNYPDVFKLSVFTERWYSNVSVAYWTTNAAGQYVDGGGNIKSSPVNSSGSGEEAAPSPEAPQADLDLQANAVVQPIQAIAAAIAPHKIGVILNGGERGIGVEAQNLTGWGLDARVAAAKAANSWYNYLSARKSNELYAVSSRLPQCDLYVWYKSYETTRFNQPGYNWESDFARWGWSASSLLGAVGIPTPESYFTLFNGWTNAAGANWNEVSDNLTRHLNLVGYAIARGYPTNYSWVCGGWSETDTNRLSAIDRYVGFLRCLYTSGTIGVNAGYYAFPISQTNSYLLGGPGFDASFADGQPPHWLQQIAAASRVHAQFTWLEDYIWDGSLLAGNGNMIVSPHNVHATSRDQPSYEFTNTVADANCRVLARKHNDRDEWLICAWAAHGDARPVTVSIPTLGSTTVTASPAGNIYRAISGSVRLLNELGRPVDMKLVATSNFRIR